MPILRSAPLRGESERALLALVTLVYRKHAVFASDLKGKRHIWRMNIDGSNPVQLTDGAGEDHPYCSSDGQWVF